MGAKKKDTHLQSICWRKQASIKFYFHLHEVNYKIYLLNLQSIQTAHAVLCQKNKQPNQKMDRRSK